MHSFLFLAYGFTISIMVMLASYVIWDYRRSIKYAQKRQK